jgi:hypothetical protein
MRAAASAARVMVVLILMLWKLKEDSEYVLKVFFEVKKKVMMMESLGRRVNDGFYRILKDRLSSGSTSSLHRDSTFQPPYTE